MSVTVREQQILDLADRGMNPQQISAEMGIKKDTVRRVISYLNTGIGPDLALRRRNAAASRALKRAVLEAGGHR